MEGTSSADDDNSNRNSTEREKSSSERSPATSSRYPRQAEKRLKRDMNEKHDINAASNSNSNEPTNITPTKVTSKIGTYSPNLNAYIDVSIFNRNFYH